LNIGIIGTGVTGLTAGYELAKKGHKVTLFEAEDNLGGLVSTLKVGELKVEKCYHHIFTSDTEVIELAKELGLSKELLWKTPSNGVFMNHTIYPFSTPLDLLNFRELSFINRIKMGMLVFKAKKINNWKELEYLTSKQWIIQNSNKTVYENMWEPLLNSKFDFDSEKISAVWIWNKFKLRGSTRSKSMSKELLGYMNNSFGLLYKRLADVIVDNGGRIFLSTRVNKIKVKENETIDLITESEALNFDKVIFTAAPSLLKEMDMNLNYDYLEKIDKIKYKSNICMMLELKEQLSPYYWVTIADKSYPFVLLIEHTNLIQEEKYKSHIVYLSRYLDENHEINSYSEEKIKELFIEYLQKMFPNWSSEQIINTHLYKFKYAQPVITKEYSKVLPEYNMPIKNLYLASMAQIYPEDRGQNYAIKMGKEVAKLI